MRANLNGTDLVPRLLTETAGKGYTYYLLGADEATMPRLPNMPAKNSPAGNSLVIIMVTSKVNLAWPIIESINRLQPHLLLVGMWQSDPRTLDPCASSTTASPLEYGHRWPL